MVGLQLRQYRIDAVLGDGGMGVVYRAYDERLHRHVAIKVLKDGPPVPNTALLKEARAAAALQHPGICVVYEAGEHEGVAFIAMELVDGVPLSRLIPPDTGLPLDSALGYAVQIADALAYAHDNGVLHRDLKSGNILVSSGGRVRILDFGLAVRLRERDANDATATVPGSAEGRTVAGTLAYMAPELFQGQPADRRTDIWAFGVVLYEMVTGRRPFAGHTEYELSSAILTRDHPRLPSHVGSAIAAIIRRCLAKDPTARYRTMAEVTAALTTAREADRHRPWRPRGWHGVAATAAVLAATVALGLFTMSRSPLQDRPRRVAIVADVRQPLPSELDAMVDGIVERVINTLAETEADRLRVIALSSVRRYKGRAVDLDQVARELNVDNVATLRVTPAGSSLVISGELADARDHSHLWGGRFTASPTTVLLVQDELAARILAGLNVDLRSDQRRQLAKGATTDPDAYLLYLRGRYAWYEPTETGEGYEESLQYYQQAIARDPRFALAQLGEADTFLSMAIEGWMPATEAIQKADTALKAALALEPDLPQAHYTRGTLAWVGRGSWREALEQNQAATALNPTSPHYHRHFAQLLILVGRFQEGIAEYERGVSVDPLGLASNSALGSGYFWTRQYAKAEDQYRKAISLSPTSGALHEMLSHVYAVQHKEEQAFAAFIQSLELSESRESREVAGQLRVEAARIGREAAVRQFHADQLAIARAASEKLWVSPMELAFLSIQASRYDEAFDWLEKARLEHQPWLHYLRVDPAFDPIRSDPRFATLVQRVGTPWRQ